MADPKYGLQGSDAIAHQEERLSITWLVRAPILNKTGSWHHLFGPHTELPHNDLLQLLINVRRVATEAPCAREFRDHKLVQLPDGDQRLVPRSEW